MELELPQEHALVLVTEGTGQVRRRLGMVP